MTKKLILSIVALAITLVLAVTVTFAWFQGTYNTIENWNFTTAKIEISSDLYKISDFNRDGTLDIDENGEFLYDIQGYKDVNHTMPIYVINTRPSLNNVVPLEINSMIPGDVVTFRIVVHNLGTTQGRLNMRMMVNDTASERNKMRDVLKFNLLDNTDQSITKGFFLLASTIDSNGYNVIMKDGEEISSLVIPSETNSEILFSLSFETLYALQQAEAANNVGKLPTDAGYSTKFQSMSNLNDYASRSVGIILEFELMQEVS